MISFNQLGNLGRLGNQMFQYASLRGIAANRGFDCCIPYENVFGVSDPNVKNSPDNIYTCFNLDTFVGLPNQKMVKESGYIFMDTFNQKNTSNILKVILDKHLNLKIK